MLGKKARMNKYSQSSLEYLAGSPYPIQNKSDFYEKSPVNGDLSYQIILTYALNVS